MKFSKLVKIITEAKGTKPGERYFNARNQEKPAGIVSGPLGKGGNFEKRQNLNRWEFNPALDLDKKSSSGVAEASKIWKAMKNAFGILANDATFQTQVNEIAKEFDKNRDEYKNLISLELGDLGKIDMAYDEEAKSNSLPKTIQTQESRLTGYESEIRKRQIIVNHNKMSPSQKLELEKRIAGLKGTISVLEKAIATSKSEGKLKRANSLTAELVKSNEQLNRWEDVWSHLGISKSGLESIKSEIFDYQKKIEEWTKKLEKNKEELENLTTRTQNIESNNQENNDKALEQFKHLISSSARKLSMRLRNEEKDKQRLNSLDDVDWENVPTDAKTKIGMLDSLASLDPKVNPVFGFLDRLSEVYYGDVGESGEKIHVKELDEREFNPQLNISKIRDYNSLPFIRLLKIYTSIRNESKKEQIPLTSFNFEIHNDAYNWLGDELKRIKSSPYEWSNPTVKGALALKIKELEIPDKDKQDLFSHLNDDWTVNKRGFTIAQQFWSRVESYCRDIKAVQKESFDNYAHRLILNSIFDEDDYKCNIMEIFK